MGIELAKPAKKPEQLTFEHVLFCAATVTPRGDGSYVITPGKPESRICTKKAAQMLGVAQRTVRRYVETGLLPAERVGVKLLRLKPEDVQNLITAA